MKRIDWMPYGGYICNAVDVVRNRRLAVTVMLAGDTWRAIAVESANDTAGDLDAVLADHAHKMIGEWDNPRDALTDSEAYALRWLGESPTSDRCDCGEIPEVRLP
jgi:hypothetical protein